MLNLLGELVLKPESNPVIDGTEANCDIASVCQSCVAMIITVMFKLTNPYYHLSCIFNVDDKSFDNLSQLLMLFAQYIYCLQASTAVVSKQVHRQFLRNVVSRNGDHDAGMP